MIRIPVDQPPDLAVLEAFLRSDQAPEDCMEISELDGFLAGIVAGPETIMPSEWLPLMWGGGEPVFDDMQQANAILGAIMNRYNEASRQLDAMPPQYRPILAQAEDGSLDATQWAVGFLEAVDLRQKAWQALVKDKEAAIMIIPIVLIASTLRKEGEGEAPVPPEEMAKLLADPAPLLSLSAATIRAHFMDRRLNAAGNRAASKAKVKVKPKRAPSRSRRH